MFMKRDRLYFSFLCLCCFLFCALDVQAQQDYWKVLSNVTYRQAEKVAAQLAELDGVSSVAFDDSTDHFKDSSALFSVSFTGEEGPYKKEQNNGSDIFSAGKDQSYA